jgi:transcription-repair coupling factor (superfamily II helicase)
LPLSARPAVIAALSKAADRPMIVVSSRSDRSDVLASAVSEFLDSTRSVVTWPAPAGLPYERLPRDSDQSADFVAALARLAGKPNESIVFASAASITHAVMLPVDLDTHTYRLRRGELIRQAELGTWAASVGFEPVTIVQRVGEFARRGGIIDIYPPGASGPVRLDFFGDEVDSIRLFDPNSQRSHERLDSITLLPALELPVWNLGNAVASFRKLNLGPLRFEVREELERTLERAADGIPPSAIDLFAPYMLDRPTTILDHLPTDVLVVLDDPGTVELAGAQRDEHARDHYLAAVHSGELPAGMPSPFVSSQSVFADLSGRQMISLGSAGEPAHASLSFEGWTAPPQFAGRITDIVSTVEERSKAGWRVELATDQVERLTEIFEEQGIYPRRSKGDARGPRIELAPGDVEIVPSDLDGGFEVASSKLMLLTDLELYGFHKTIRAREPKRREAARAFAESLTPGDHVVHIDHGVAQFQGLIRMEQGGVEREYLLLEFAKGERLYVPVDQSHRVTVYSSGGLTPALSTLGSGEWVKTKRRVRRAVRDMAYELINLYAARDAAVGYQYGPDTTWDRELDTSFPYTETVDQARAIVDVKGDMLSDKPMDRLICGDVGFGKTEVAMRAAFKAVNAGKQVAVLVPTTVLALQHFATFSQRLAAFPVRVEMLSRLRSEKEQRETIKGLADGSVDIVIGTHRLVQRDVKFKDLGLVVIDEEQRFGVRQKEFLKQLRTEVDVITMSATPIPRTLHIALAGIRDISVIETAPNARLPIRTFVTKTDDQLVRDVILREIERGGQVFFVHNRVHSINKVVQRLHELVPEARIGVGHGQMDEDVLESVMMKFVKGDFDVLVCTTIIESGLDIPNVNTIIINHADKFGLAQLYQLRGRVGRSAARAYAYLLYEKHMALSEVAQKRLQAIFEATELGAGFQIALHDLEIRGAGNLLGAEQSGQIGTVGFDLYVKLLADAVEGLKALAKGEQPPPSRITPPVTIDLPLAAFIPESYVSDLNLRLSLYQRLARVRSESGVRDMRRELEDRFGPLPQPAENLLLIVRLKIMALRAGVEAINTIDDEFVIVLGAEAARRRLGPQLHYNLGIKLGDNVRVTQHQVRLQRRALGNSWVKVLEDTLEELIEAAA